MKERIMEENRENHTESEKKQESRIADVMKEFHRGTMWEFQGGEMAALALEDTTAKILNYYVVQDRAWEHGKVEDFISMDEGSGDYTVYALCSDGVVLMIPDHELDEPTIINFQNQRVKMIHHMPKQVKDTEELADRILAEKDRLLDELEKGNYQRV
jgi:hypothetical protein